MASKFVAEYRERFSDFSTELNREEYLFYSGQKERSESAHILSEYRDLFTREAAEQLRAEWKATEAYRETERAAIKLLIAISLAGHFKSSVRELSAEITNYESHASFQWEGESLSLRRAANRLAEEPEVVRRRDLDARRLEIIKGGQDLRAERLEKLQAAAHAAGYDSYLAAYRDLRGIDYDRLAAQVGSFLSFTESRYVTALAPLLLRDANVSIDEATRADLSYLQRLSDYDQYFPAWRLPHIYRETFAGLGILTYQQPNVWVDEEPRPRQRQPIFHSPIRVPDEVRLVISPSAGQRECQILLREAGQTQHYAWTSRHLHPEFRFSGDYAVNQAYGLLFNHLVYEEPWLAEALQFGESRRFRQALAVHKLMRVRRYAAKLIYETELHAGKLAGAAGARYAELMTDAVRVHYEETEHLSDLSDAFRAADYLRAAAFEAQLREYLKTKYGLRWWASRKAGELLIDVWNTGGRYQADELAAQIGLGQLSFDWLAAELLGQIA